jgi:hypothetical protein
VPGVPARRRRKDCKAQRPSRPPHLGQAFPNETNTHFDPCVCVCVCVCACDNFSRLVRSRRGPHTLRPVQEVPAAEPMSGQARHFLGAVTNSLAPHEDPEQAPRATPPTATATTTTTTTATATTTTTTGTVVTLNPVPPSPGYPPPGNEIRSTRPETSQLLFDWWFLPASNDANNTRTSAK